MKSCKIRQVAMEATGVYWIPLFEVLDRLGFEVILVNGRQTKRAAARKSDVLDCQWIQQMMMFGLLSGSFRPADALCAVRAVVRLRARLIRDGQRAVQHMDKALVQMNVQLGRLLADLSGMSGMAIIRAIVAGERDGVTLSAMCDRRVRTSPEVIAKSLVGTWRDEHLLELKQAVATYDLVQAHIAECDGKIAQAVGALAYGAGPILPVDKIVGPGNAFVTAAKLPASKATATAWPVASWMPDGRLVSCRIPFLRCISWVMRGRNWQAGFGCTDRVASGISARNSGPTFRRHWPLRGMSPCFAVTRLSVAGPI